MHAVHEQDAAHSAKALGALTGTGQRGEGS
jgi:hypothetical protein